MTPAVTLPEQRPSEGASAQASSAAACRSQVRDALGQLGGGGPPHRRASAGSPPLSEAAALSSAFPASLAQAERFEYDGVAYDRPRYSVPQVKKAGEQLRQDQASYEDLEIIGNWRSSHALPLLAFRITLSNWGHQVQKDVLISQRLKRLTSISSKLKRIRRLRLSTIQDIGGCRAVLSSERRARSLYERYLVGGLTHELVRYQNYVDEPKESGYRGFHLIYAYKGRESTVVYDGMLIEIQIRSAGQHAWATAVETVDIFTRQALKSSMGSPEWDEFFKLMASYIAQKEQCPAVPGTPSSKAKLKTQIRKCQKNVQALRRLHDFRQITTEFDTEAVRKATSERFPQYFLLEVRPDDLKIMVSAYKNAALPTAEQHYLATERKILSEKANSDAVLVSVSKLNNLRKAYPSYYGDTDLFMEIIKEAIAT
jgi:hypothetical protein